MSWLKTAHGVVARWGSRLASRFGTSSPPRCLVARSSPTPWTRCWSACRIRPRITKRPKHAPENPGAQDLERVGSILDECNGHLAGLMEQVVKLDGLPESADRIILLADNLIRQQRATDARVQAGFANIARFAEQIDRIEAKIDRLEEQIRQLAERNHVRGDEARKLTVSITNEKEREVLRRLRDEYRKLPPEQQNVESLTLLADSLSTAGQFSQASEMHAEAARRAAAENKSLAAKNHYQRYRDACELGQWPVAIEALLEAARLGRRVPTVLARPVRAEDDPRHRRFRHRAAVRGPVRRRGGAHRRRQDAAHGRPGARSARSSPRPTSSRR